MDLNIQKELFSNAYVRAIASVAGFSCLSNETDDKSVDITFESSDQPFPKIDAQLKATASEDYIKDGFIHYPLPIKNYNELRCNSLTQRILICILVPVGVPASWIDQTEDQLSLMKCAYWMKLNGLEDKSNNTTVTVKIPMTQLFTPQELHDLMETESNKVLLI